jgi:hypothetical protein
MKQQKKARFLKKTDTLWISGTRHKITSVKSMKMQGKPMIRVEAAGIPAMLFNLNDKVYIVEER